MSIFQWSQHCEIKERKTIWKYMKIVAFQERFIEPIQGFHESFHCSVWILLILFSSLILWKFQIILKIAKMQDSVLCVNKVNVLFCAITGRFWNEKTVKQMIVEEKGFFFLKFVLICFKNKLRTALQKITSLFLKLSKEISLFSPVWQKYVGKNTLRTRKPTS